MRGVELPEETVMMAPLEARQLLQALVQGFDPVSGAELAAATPLQHAEVIQALLAAIGALDEQAARTRTTRNRYVSSRGG